MYLKLRLTGLNYNLLLFLGGRGSWDTEITVGALIRLPSAQCQAPFSLHTLPGLTYLLYCRRVILKTLKSLISHPDFTNNSNLYIQLST